MQTSAFKFVTQVCLYELAVEIQILEDQVEVKWEGNSWRVERSTGREQTVPNWV
jgi:hypothetical protein